MGDLTDGDEVFAPDGQPTKLIAHPVTYDRPCWAVRFADGQEIIADGDHLWQVTEVDRDGRAQRRVVNTDQIREAGIAHEWVRQPRSRNRRIWRWRVELPVPPEFPAADLPLDPWLLGFWIGDGNRASGNITAGAQDLLYLLERLDGLGEIYKVRPDRRWPERVFNVAVAGLSARLRAAGVLGAKHIPDVYMTASVQQRRDLLAGIMDSDGTVSDGRQIAVTMTDAGLMDHVLCLVRSLGYRATLREFRARLNGADAGPMYRVQFAPNGVSPFQLPRKTEAIHPLKRGRSAYNAIIAIEPAPTRPMRCITVAHESGCYLVGRGFVVTHNTA
jgi:hypothetical protein